jgi:hypothetical protein
MVLYLEYFFPPARAITKTPSSFWNNRRIVSPDKPHCFPNSSGAKCCSNNERPTSGKFGVELMPIYVQTCVHADSIADIRESRLRCTTDRLAL